AFFRGFNFVFDKLSLGYGGLTRRLLRAAVIVLIVYAGLIGLTFWQFARAPTGFIPNQDQGYLITVIQLPPGASLARTDAVVRRAANQIPGLTGVFSLFNTRTPKIYADIDRVRAEMLGVTPDRVFEALQVYLGSIYVNDFNYLGRTYRVTAQADAPYRADIRDIKN